uniref:Uncharacterized protein n=1 Tax=Panagrolaimus sp. JU765 TaxID=591449 RepID=A0AC34Q3V2_9BILA
MNDYVGIQNIKNARSAGWKYVDGYIFPCLKKTCAPARAQVQTTVDKLREKGAVIGILWLDIERFAWPADKNYNRQFITDMINQLKIMGVPCGIYTNYNNWAAIVGADWTGGADKPLWWATFNGCQDHTGFKPFGGWSKPATHQ